MRRIVRIACVMSSGPGLTSPRHLFFRQLMAEEARLRISHLERLRPEDRRSRFMAEIDVRVVDQDRQLASPDLMVGAFADGCLIGVAELYVAQDEQVIAEVAVTVEQAFQGRGIGTGLVERVLILARDRGIHRVVSRCLTANARMQRIARRIGARLGFDLGDSLATLELDRPDPAIRALEQIDVAAGTSAA